MKILYKIASVSLLMTLLFVFIEDTNFSNIEVLSRGFNSMNSQALPVIDSLNRMRLAALELFSATAEIMLFSMDEGGLSKEIEMHEMQEIAEAKEGFNESFARYSFIVEAYFPDEPAARDRMLEKWNLLVHNSDEMLKFRGNARESRGAIFAKQQEFEESKEALLDEIDSALIHESNRLGERQADIRETSDESLRNIRGGAIAFLILSAAGIVISYSISKSIILLSLAAENIGKGNLNAKVKIDSKDEIGTLASAFNRMTDDLKRSGKDLEERENELNKKVNELTGTKSALLNMMEDADELNKKLVAAQEKLEENLKELQEADIKKKEFMSIAAHELKTPMTSIHGFSQLLQDREVAGNPEKRDRYLKIMDHETKRLAKLVNDVLDLSKADIGAIKFELEEVDINPLFDSLKTEMGVQIKARGLEAEYDVDKDIPVIVTDRERLAQILMNLINNAVKYTPKGKITVKAFREGDGVHFMVKDTGIGIPRKYRHKIFTRFYQVDSSYTRSAGGVGLGLSLCREFVERLGGQIWFKSDAGKGSEFHFTLPIKASLKDKKEDYASRTSAR